MSNYADLVTALRSMSKVSAALSLLLPDGGGNKAAELYDEAADAIEKLEAKTAADVVEVKHGGWLTKEYVYNYDDNGDAWVDRQAQPGDEAFCSLCGEMAGMDDKEYCTLTPYCPNCGAKMDGGGEDATK